MKKVFFVLLSLSLGCFAQNAASNSATTTAPQTAIQSAAPTPPLVVPSNVALPGSGPPMGAPLTNVNTNDSRTGGTVQVYNPATVLEHPVTGASGETANTPPAASSEVPFNAGLQSFSGSSSASQASAGSLGDIARQYRGKPHQSARMFTNDSILQLSGGQPLPQGKEMSQAPQQNVQHEMAMAAAIPPMSASNPSSLPQNDSSAAGTAQQSGRVDQQKRTSSNPAAADQSAANTGSSSDQAAPSSDDQSGSNSSRLPASGSELPLLALLGVAVASGGAIYRFRR